MQQRDLLRVLALRLTVKIPTLRRYICGVATDRLVTQPAANDHKTAVQTLLTVNFIEASDHVVLRGLARGQAEELRKGILADRPARDEEGGLMVAVAGELEQLRKGPLSDGVHADHRDLDPSMSVVLSALNSNRGRLTCISYLRSSTGMAITFVLATREAL